MAMGTVWETGTWADGSWADSSWADVPAILWEQIAYYSDLHDALTIDGTSPLSLDGQAISLKNDAAAAITKINRVLADSDEEVPTSKAVKTAVEAEVDAVHLANVTVTVKASGGDFATIQGAIDYFKNKTVTGNNYINIDPGTYDEELSVRDINLTGTLSFIGDSRGLAGLGYVAGAAINNAITNAGNGVISFSRGGAGNTVLTVTGATSSPDFDADGWVAGDKVLVYTGTTPNTVVEMTLASVSNNALTATGAWPDPAAGTSGAGYSIVLEPNVKITNTTPTTNLLSQLGVATVYYYGLYLKQTSSSYHNMYINSSSKVNAYGLLLEGGYYSLAVVLQSTFTAYNTGFTAMGSSYGVIAQRFSYISMGHQTVIKVPSNNAGISSQEVSSIYAPSVKCVKCHTGMYAYYMSHGVTWSASFIGCTTSTSPAVNTVGNGNSYILG